MSQSSPDLTIARWRKNGNDRLYVALADGTRVGYWDLVTDEAHPERPESTTLRAVLEAAHDVWLNGRDHASATARRTGARRNGSPVAHAG